MEKQTRPELPKISVSKVMKQREKLLKAFSPYLNETVEGVVFHSLVDAAHANLPKGVMRSTIKKSFISLLYAKLTERNSVTIAWRLAGNVEKLLQQEVVGSWIRQKDLEWVPVQICRISKGKKNGRVSYLFTFQSLAGSVVPMKLTQAWSSKKLFYLASFRDEFGRGFGFNRSFVADDGEQRNKLVFEDYRQMYGLRCFVLLGPGYNDGEPNITEIAVSSTMMEYNRELIVGRDRFSTDCVKSLPGNPSCYLCGLGVDRCRFATHKKTFVTKMCKFCDKKGVFDPDAPSAYRQMCLDCFNKESFS